jgi:hypothetical protein
MRSAVIGAVMVVWTTMLIALAVAPAAAAGKPTREVVTQEDHVFIDQCAFPVLAHIDGVEIDTTFFDKAGSPLRLLGVFPGNTLTLTNLATTKSITLPATGAFHARAEPDGSVSVSVTGNGLVPDFVVADRGIWYLNGHWTATFVAEGSPTSVDLVGNLVNLCPQLAG